MAALVLTTAPPNPRDRKTAGPSRMALLAPKRHEVEGVAVDRLGSSFEVKGRRNSNLNNGRSDGGHF